MILGQRKDNGEWQLISRIKTPETTPEIEMLVRAEGAWDRLLVVDDSATGVREYTIPPAPAWQRVVR